MRIAARSLRRIEIALWVLGVALFGVVLAATLFRWDYQRRQERALFPREPVPVAAAERPGPVSLQREPVAAPIEAPAASIEPAAASTGRLEAKRVAALDPGVLGRIEIPRIGVAAIVKEGGDEATLSRAVGLIPGSPRPGDAGNVVLAGHRDTFFRPLRRIRQHDRIRVVVPPHTYEYEVQSLRVVSPEETSVLESRGEEELTLVTCYPFRFVGPAPDRFIVSAARVN
jgi:sortase A